MADDDLLIRAKLRDELTSPLQRLRQEVADVGDTTEKTGKQAAAAGPGFGKMAGGIGKAVKVLGGLAAMGTVADQFNKALDFQAGTSKLNAQLGLSKTQSAQAGRVAGTLFGQGYGTGMDQVQESIKFVIQDIDGMRTASDSTLTSIAGKVANVANIFDQELGGVTRATSQLMRTGLAKNATEALDIVTKGFQSGANKSDDFLDTLNEYGTQFRKLGLNGKEATGLLSQGLKGGARDADLVADSLKEFSLRTTGPLVKMTNTKDGPVASLTALGSAFQAAGFDAASNSPKIAKQAFDMQAKIAGGGKGARKGLQIMLDGLRNTKDPLTRTTNAVALFGTQAEDMGAALYDLDPSKAVTELGKVKGAADKAGDAFNDNAKAKVGTFFRGIQAGATTILAGKVIPILEDLGPKIDATFKFIDKHKRTIVGLGIAVAVVTGLVEAHALVMAVAAAGGLLQYLKATKLISSATKVYAAFQWALNAALTANPIGLIVLAIAALVTGLVIAYKKSETFRKIVDGAFHAVAAAGKWLWNNVLQPVFKFLVKGFAFVMDMYAKLLDGLSHVPGFGWAKKAADGMRAGADQARSLADNIKKIPNDKRVEVHYDAIVPSNAQLNRVDAMLNRGQGGRIMGGIGDTYTSRARGRGNLASTFAAHHAISSATGARTRVTNVLTGGGGRGYGSGDHQAGRALDLTGTGLGAYARATRAAGGYAAFHGSGAGRHLHAVPAPMGDTATSKARTRPLGSRSGSAITIAPGAIMVDARGAASDVDVAAAVKDGIETWLRDREERD